MNDYQLAKKAYDVDEIGVWNEYSPENISKFRTYLWDFTRKEGRKKYFTTRIRKRENKVLVWLNSFPA